MQLLRMLGYKGLSMRDLEPYLRGEVVGKVVGITFDDGYQNNLVNALPVLANHGFTATCYAVSHLTGGHNTWDQGRVEQKQLMSSQELRTWSNTGMDLGSHTRNHLDLTKVNPKVAQEEIAHSKEELEQVVGTEVRHFCYPYGRYNEFTVALVKQANYQTATTTTRGKAIPKVNDFELPRVMIARATNPIQFLLKVATSYEDNRRIDELSKVGKA
jgi:peptidoglycan/xylan/chitin deacetylase (PgdA/CDA1 family)